MITRPIDPSKKACERCGCPLLLLKLEKRRWESRKVCARCGEAKAPMALDRLLERGESKGLKTRFKKALMEMPLKGGT